MKKQIYNIIIVLLLIFSGTSFSGLYAQCPGCLTNMNFIVTPAAPGINPDTLPNGTAGQYYDADVNFYLPAQFTSSGTNVTLTKLEVLSVAGLPFGISFQTSSATNTFFPSQNPPTTEHGCAKVCGTAIFPGQYNMVVFVRAYVNTLIGSQTSDNSFTIPIKILPGSSGNASFTITNGTGCGSVTASFHTNLPSNGVSGYSYFWSFGNGLTSSSENPPDINYNTPGQYDIICHTVIDTLSFNYLNNVTVLGTSCTDLGSAPDPYIIVKNQAGTKIYQSATIVDTNPPVSFTIPGLQLYHNQNYTIEVWDEDGGLAGGDDQCYTFSIAGTAASNSMWSGSDGISFVTVRPVLSFTDTVTVHVYPQPVKPVISAVPATGACINDSILLTSTHADNYQWFNDTTTLLGATIQNMYVHAAGKYFVLITDNNGCQAQSDTTFISFYNNPPKPTFWRIGDTLKTILSGFNLQWYFNSNPINGATGQTCIVTVSGNYSLVATSSHGCTKSSEVVYYSPTSHAGIEDTENIINDFTLYPNPNDGRFNVKFNAHTNTNLTLTIFNMLGQQLYYEALPNFSGSYEKEPDIRLNPSVYFMELRANGAVLRRDRIVVQ